MNVMSDRVAYSYLGVGNRNSLRTRDAQAIFMKLRKFGRILLAYLRYLINLTWLWFQVLHSCTAVFDQSFDHNETRSSRTGGFFAS